MTVLGIVGAGAVGQATAVATSATKLGHELQELILVSRTVDQATALAADVQDQCAALAATCRIRAGRPRDLRGCDAVVVAARAAFHNTRTRDVRMDGMQANAALIARLGSTLSDHRGTVLVVTNPVDVMSRLMAQTSGNPRVYGVGSALDTARYRAILAQQLTVSVTAISGHVIGEHGDAAVICASTTTVNGRPADIALDSVRSQLHARPGVIRSGIGRVKAGAAGAVVSALHKILGLVDGVEELSTAYQGGWLGVPVRFTNGRPEVVMPALNALEHGQFLAAQAKLCHAYQSVAHQTEPKP